MIRRWPCFCLVCVWRRWLYLINASDPVDI